MISAINKEDIINQYIQSGIIMYNATLNGDYKTNNKEGKKIIKTFKYLETNLVLAEESLVALFDNENVVTRTKAASHCLALNIRTQEAIKILESAANDENNGIFGFNAEMTLKVWREKGHLQIYQK